MAGGGSRRLLDCAALDSVVDSAAQAAESIWVAASGSLGMRHCRVQGNGGYGLRAAGGQVSLTNCLVSRCGSSGVRIDGGAAVLANVTLADNVGWGLSQSAGTVTVSNSLAWRNGSGGLHTTDATVAYTCSQETQAGTSNLTDDPKLVFQYYLSVSGLTWQATDSPCIDRGGADAGAPGLGLDTRTTRTDDTDDVGVVDLGYHHAAGQDPALLSNFVLYVDAVAGDDANDGWAADDALKTLTEAFARTVAGGTLHVAAGTYGTGNGETFPLTVPDTHLSILGTNESSTLVSGDGARRVLTVQNKGSLRIEGLTIQNGYANGLYGGGVFADGTDLIMTQCRVLNNQSVGGTALGGGLYLLGSDLTGDNLLVQGNRVNGKSMAGGGVYVSGGTTRIRDSVWQSNYTTGTHPYPNYCRAGALCAMSAVLELSNCTFRANYALESDGWGKTYGGALYLSGGRADVQDCLFTNNSSRGRQQAYGGAVYAVNTGPVTLDRCTWRRNYVTAGTRQGGTLRIGNSTVTLASCVSRANGLSSTQPGEIYMASGTLNVTHTLIAANWGNGITCAGGTLGLVNCTVAGQSLWGIYRSAGTATVRNSIVVSNTSGGIYANGTVAVSSSCSQASHPGEGNIVADPLFVNPAGGDYHLMSRTGSWNDQLATWVSHSSDSPCIDAGLRADAYALEPKPNGGRINLGAFGNTLQASMTTVRGAVILVR